ncbi:F-box protein PP2-A11 [Hibiscus syriacus]|uniref:F-box protein PP2-A11 n=1 Tax=Hibiscus syriacus TaxID=106335 RepID=A0A6A2WI81_HIBSY|nr:F-box protein PP2-A12-like [Hibiscus syriacus]KAE8658508.1 F-box protein PP2-A11 [Hibiscus syriacus]
MGANFSALFITDCLSSVSYSSCSSSSTSLGDLPESCLVSIIGYLDPSEICKLAKLNRAFRCASLADFVWESKLPPNYQLLVDKILPSVPENLGKRDIYSRLCRTNTLDGGTKKVWLDKSTGGVCMAISSKGLHVTGIDDRRYWNHIPTDESRFHSTAYLQQIWWFEVDGEVEFPFPPGSYSVFFRLQLGRASKRFGRRIINSENIHGWDIKPVRFKLWTSDGQYATSQCTLNEPGKWFHYHMGDFNVENSNSWTKIKLSMTQIDCTHTKGGLCLDSAVIYPSKFRERLKHKGFLKC